MSHAVSDQQTCRRRLSGFTLIELMVALGIFMVLGLLSYRALSSIIESRDRVTVEQQRWQAITRFMQRLELDLQQIPLRLPDALTYDPAAQTLRLIRLVASPAGDEARTVRYRWRNGVVERDERKGMIPLSGADNDQLVEPEVVLEAAPEIEWWWSDANPQSGAPLVWQLPPLTLGKPPPAAIQLRLKLAGVTGDLFRVVALQ